CWPAGLGALVVVFQAVSPPKVPVQVVPVPADAHVVWPSPVTSALAGVEPTTSGTTPTARPAATTSRATPRMGMPRIQTVSSPDSGTDEFFPAYVTWR